MRKWIASVLLLAVPGITGGAELSVQEALLRAKPAVALVVSEVASEIMVSCPTGGQQRVIPTPFRETGTGWFITPNGWVITNAHVVSPAHLPPKAIVDRQVEDGVRRACGDIGQQALSTVIARAQVKLNPSISVILSNGIRLPATVVRYSPPVAGEGMSGRDLALLKLDAADMPSLTLGDSSNAKLGDKLHILGFPGVVLSHELLSASAQVEASVTNGAISGFKQDIANQPVIQTDAPATWGNSGGPAVGSQGEVLGVLTFVTLESGGQGGIVQGFNFVIPSAAIREFLKGTEVRLDETSRFNVAWHAGLADYFAGNYARAEKHFAEARADEPHSQRDVQNRKPSKWLLTADTPSDLQIFLSKLSVEERAVAHLVYASGCSHRETADAMQIAGDRVDVLLRVVCASAKLHFSVTSAQAQGIDPRA